MKKVSADTIAELTAAAALTPGSGGTPPTAGQMIDQIRTKLTLKVTSLTKSMQQGQKNGQGPTAFKISYQRAVEEVQEFEQIVANVPRGFRLTPVLYSVIESSQNSRVYSQFGSYVRPEFMRYLANDHAGELATLGVCPQGIDRMKKGLDPVDPNGRLYDVNIDHIIERFGGGKASLTQEVDPLMPPGSKPTYLVNHFSNFILLPTQVHNLKNKLNELQDAPKTPQGESKWVLMIVPKAGPAHAGYVAQPQGQLQTRQGNVHVRRTNPLQLAESTSFSVGNILDCIARNPGQKERHTELLKPALEDLAGRLTTAFNEVSKARQNPKPFLRFYQGKKFKALRQELEGLPPDETTQLRKTLQWIDGGIEARFNRHAKKKPANNNKKSPAKNKISKPVIPQPPHVPHRKKQKKNKHGDKRR